MPSAQQIINLALADLGVIRPGENVSAAVSGDCLTRLNQRIGAHSIEQLLVQTQKHAGYALQAGISRYTFGISGTFGTTARPQKLTGWRAYSGAFEASGRVLTFEELQAASSNPLGSSTVLPQAVGADAAFPLINVGVFPVPGTAPGTLELSWFEALTQFADLGTVYTFPSGWDDFLHFDLAMALLPRYGRQGFDPTVLAADNQTAKAKIVALNQSAQQPAA